VVKVLTFILLGIICFFYPGVVWADFSFFSNATSINAEQELEVTVDLNLQGQINKLYYLEGAFKKEGSSNYFGLTEVDGSWVKYTSSNYTFLKQITTDSQGEWSGTLRVKLDTTSNLYQGAGSYIFQLKRFTSSGSSSWSDNLITLNVIANSINQISASSPSPAVIASSQPAPSNNTKSSTEAIFTANLSSQTINSTEALVASTKITGLKAASAYYLKGAFFKTGSTNYFGKTLVSGNWVKNSQSSLSQFPIKTDNLGSWSGSISFMPDMEDSGYTGSGQYFFKVARYNSSGSDLAWSNQNTVNINHISSNTISSPKPTVSSSTSVNQAVLGLVKVDSSNDLDSLEKEATNSSLSSWYKVPELSTVSVEATHTGDLSLAGIKGIKFNPWNLAGGLTLAAAGILSLVLALKTVFKAI
jgi:hypothetical protein